VVAEGPVWDSRREKFLFLDIRGQCIWEEDKKITLSQQIGCMALCENGDMLVSLEDGIYRMRDGKIIGKAHQEIKLKGRRFNDGKIGPDGAFYLGTTDENGEGALYRLKGGILTELFDKCGCSNGLEWTQDKKSMYYIDTSKQMIEIFDFNTEKGELSNRRKFIDIPPEMGKPDGMTLDEDDNLWVALWDGHKVIHIDKNKKEIIDEISVPCPKASCCAFGGKDMNELYITTADMGDFAEYPLAGSVFKIMTEIKGRAVYYYKY